MDVDDEYEHDGGLEVRRMPLNPNAYPNLPYRHALPLAASLVPMLCPCCAPRSCTSRAASAARRSSRRPRSGSGRWRRTTGRPRPSSSASCAPPVSALAAHAELALFRRGSAAVCRGGAASPTLPLIVWARLPPSQAAVEALPFSVRVRACVACAPADPKRPVHLTIASGTCAYLSLPARGRLVPGHCCIVPKEHTPSIRLVRPQSHAPRRLRVWAASARISRGRRDGRREETGQASVVSRIRVLGA